MFAESAKDTINRFLIVVLFSIAFAYIESAVVVYLRTIFNPTGFSFPLSSFSVTDPIMRPTLMTEIGREAATIVLIFTGAWLAGRNRQQRFAYFLTIFAIWDIFYYVWLRFLIMWPKSIMDWDILFLIPRTWASAVLYPVIIATTMLIFSIIIIFQDYIGKPIKANTIDWLGFWVATVIVIVSFCTAGPYVTSSDYASHFYWPIFAVGYAVAVILFFKCLIKARRSIGQ